MTLREFASQSLTIVLPFFLVVLTVAIPFATNWVRTHFRIAAQSTAVSAVWESALTAVSAVMQHTVASLKDPGRDGTWTPETAAAAKQLAEKLVGVLGTQALDRLKTSGYSEAQLTTLVESLVERAVLEVKTRTRMLPASPASNPASN